MERSRDPRGEIGVNPLMNLSRAAYLIRSLMTLGGPQEFLGARWVPALVRAVSPRVRSRVAMRLLSLSPHYFYGTRWLLSRADIEAESLRNNTSRRQIVDDIVAAHLRPGIVVLDYGCGPGYLSKHLNRRGATVYAVDISDGVLECARAVNPAQGIEYRNVKDGLPPLACQLACSFAVLQHLTYENARKAVDFIHAALEPGGKAVIHVVLDTDEDWEREHEPDNIILKIKRKYGLNCFARSEEDLTKLFRSCGFVDVQIRPAADLTTVDDDIRRQHILTATKRA